MNLMRLRSKLNDFLHSPVNDNINDDPNDKNCSAVFALHRQTLFLSNNNNNNNSAGAPSASPFVPEVECGIGSAPPDGTAFRPIVLSLDRRQRIIRHLMAKGFVRPHAFWDQVSLRARWADSIICEYEPVPSPSFSSVKRSKHVTSNTFKLSNIFFKHDLTTTRDTATIPTPPAHSRAMMMTMMGNSKRKSQAIGSCTSSSSSSSLSPSMVYPVAHSTGFDWFNSFRRSQLLFEGHLPEAVRNMTHSQKQKFDAAKKEYELQLAESGGLLGKRASLAKERLIRDIRRYTDYYEGERNDSKSSSSSSSSSSPSASSIGDGSSKIGSDDDVSIIISDRRSSLQLKSGTSFSAGYKEMARRSHLRSRLIDAGLWAPDHNDKSNDHDGSAKKVDVSSPRVVSNASRFREKQSTFDTGRSGQILPMSTAASSYHHEQQISTRRTLGFKCRFRGEISLLPSASTSTSLKILASMPYTDLEYRMRRIYRSEKYGVEIHITSSRPMRNRKKNRALGHLGDGRIVLARLPFVGDEDSVSRRKKKIMQQQKRIEGRMMPFETEGAVASSRNRTNSNAAGNENEDENDKAVAGDDSDDGKEDELDEQDEEQEGHLNTADPDDKKITGKKHQDSVSSAISKFVDEDDDLWGGHSTRATIEVEMINPLEGDPEERIRKMFTVVNEIIEVGWPTEM